MVHSRMIIFPKQRDSFVLAFKRLYKLREGVYNSARDIDQAMLVALQRYVSQGTARPRGVDSYRISAGDRFVMIVQRARRPGERKEE